MPRPSAWIRGRRPCNLTKSPCISQICRERQVGAGLPAQPPNWPAPISLKHETIPVTIGPHQQHGSADTYLELRSSDRHDLACVAGRRASSIVSALEESASGVHKSASPGTGSPGARCWTSHLDLFHDILEMVRPGGPCAQLSGQHRAANWLPPPRCYD